MTHDEHLLTIAAEECAELAQRLSKALRFGLHEIQPGQPHSNRERIIAEYADLKAAMWMIGIGDDDVDCTVVAAKRAKVEHFLAYSRACGTVEPETPDPWQGKEPKA